LALSLDLPAKDADELVWDCEGELLRQRSAPSPLGFHTGPFIDQLPYEPVLSSVRERTSAALAAAQAEGRIGGPRGKLDDTNWMTPNGAKSPRLSILGRKAAAQMARMFGVSPPTVSRIVAAHVAAGTH